LAKDRDPTLSFSLQRTGVRLLLIEDNTAEARFLMELLNSTALNQFVVTHVQRLGDAIAQLHHQPTVILLDLSLPDSQGLASLDLLMQHAASVPIVVLTNTNDETLALETVRHGAQDYLLKRQVTEDNLVRSLRYAIERKQAAEALREANEILELRVQERTADLEKANQLLTQEIQHRQNMQERLELAQKVGRIGTFEWNIQTNEVSWSTELEALYGVAPGSFNGCYNAWLQRIHPEDQDRIATDLQQSIQTGTATDTEFRVIDDQGKTRWMIAKGRIFNDTTGTPHRMIGIHIDITDKKQLEAQFLRSQRLESLGTLASGIAHDLNNILTPILTVSQLLPLKLPNLDERSLHLLKMLENSAHRGSELVKQILSFARGMEGKRVCLQPKHLLLEIESILKQTLEKSIEIHRDIPSDLWSISADTTQLHQVLMNLCVNARDAMPQGGILEILAMNYSLDAQSAQTYWEATPGSYVMIQVSDTGIGIPPEIQDRIFDPFFTTKEVGKGTGLGLSAVLGIIKSHGGFVDVQSEAGKGSQFRVFLPASQVVPTHVGDELAPLSGQNELILVVDDEIAIREITKTTLENYNYQVLTASDGMEAIAIMAEHSNHVQGVLMDIMMPAIDGCTTMPLLRRFNPNLYAIAMSGLKSPHSLEQIKRSGFQDFLGKPFTTGELLSSLQPVSHATSIP
jgi:two-component system, cell cycle sensor histidine kinase and response regulator CckA